MQEKQYGMRPELHVTAHAKLMLANHISIEK
jgi:hypothetical protein